MKFCFGGANDCPGSGETCAIFARSSHVIKAFSKLDFDPISSMSYMNFMHVFDQERERNAGPAGPSRYLHEIGGFLAQFIGSDYTDTSVVESLGLCMPSGDPATELVSGVSGLLDVLLNAKCDDYDRSDRDRYSPECDVGKYFNTILPQVTMEEGEGMWSKKVESANGASAYSFGGLETVADGKVDGIGTEVDVGTGGDGSDNGGGDSSGDGMGSGDSTKPTPQNTTVITGNIQIAGLTREKITPQLELDIVKAIAATFSVDASEVKIVITEIDIPSTLRRRALDAGVQIEYTIRSTKLSKSDADKVASDEVGFKRGLVSSLMASSDVFEALANQPPQPAHLAIYIGRCFKQKCN